MMRTIAVLLTLALAAAAQEQTPQQSTAAPPPPDNSLGALPKRLFKDERRIWTSPWKSKSYDSRSFKKYIVPFALISTVLIATDRKTADHLPNTNDQTLWSGRVSQMGAAYTLGGFSGATYLFGRITGNDHAQETGLLALEALAHTQVAVFAIKQATNRQRPIYSTGGTRAGFWRGGDSFPSGHSASAFAVATVFAREYRDHLAVPIVAYSLAGAISVSRIGARRHWMSDIFAGGSLGFLLGRFTYRANHDRRLPGSKVSAVRRLVPNAAMGPWGPSLSWTF